VVLSSAATGAAKSVVGAVLDGLWSEVSNAVAWVVTTTSTWWVGRPSGLGDGQGQVIDQIRGYVYPLVVMVLVGGLMVQGIRLAIQRRGDPMVRVARGLATFAVASAVGTLLVTALQSAGDAFSTWVLDASTDGQFADRLTKALLFASVKTVQPPTILLLLFGVIALVVSLVQAMLMMFREAAVIVLTGVLLLAAAGTLTESTQAWWSRVVGWSAALIFYKPAAALVYASAFTLLGSSSASNDGVQMAFVGAAMIVLSILALPALMRLFTWTTGELQSGGGGGGQLLQSAGYAMQAASMLRDRKDRKGGSDPGGGYSAARHAEFLAQRAPTPTNSPSGGAPGGGGGAPGGGAPGGGAPAGGAGAAGAAKAGADLAGRAGRGAADTVSRPPSAGEGG
jgi:type IV secretion system protein TrbL